MPVAPTNPVRAWTRPLRIAIVALAVLSGLALGLTTPDAARADDVVTNGLSDPELDRLQAACRAGRAGAWDELVDWAEQHDRTAEVETWLRTRIDRSPGTTEVHDALDRMCADRTLPAHSTAYHAARGLLPAAFLEYETKRFVVLSDADATWSREQAARLERAHHQFLRFARRLGVRPLPLRHKLVCVLFRVREDYQVFARDHDDVQDPWIAGYYAPLTDRVVFYHGESNPSVVEARARLDQMRDDLERATVDAPSSDRRMSTVHASMHDHRHEYMQHIERERRRVDAFAEQVSIATTVHEAVHQLLFHTGVQSLSVQYPLWISEGLATAFETSDPDHAFGPDFEYDPRRAAFDEMLAAGEVLPLHELVTWTRIPAGDDRTVHAVYHGSYALVTWLTRYRRQQLRTYLELMRREPAGVPDAPRQLRLFETAFGPVDRLERAWLRHETARVRATSSLARTPVAPGPRNH